MSHLSAQHTNQINQRINHTHTDVLEVQHVGRGVEHLADAVAAEFPDGGVARLGDVLLDDAPDVLVGPPGLAELDGFLPVVFWGFG